MRRNVFLSLACLAVTYFFTISHKWHYFRKKKLLSRKCMFWFSPQILPEVFLILRTIQRHIIVHVQRFSCKVPFFLSDFNGTWIFSLDFEKKKTHRSYFMKICQVGTGLFCYSDWQTNTQSWTKLILVFLQIFERASQRLGYRLPATHMCRHFTVWPLTGTSLLITRYWKLCILSVKWSRYRPGVAQKVGRGIALLYHDRGTRRG